MNNFSSADNVVSEYLIYRGFTEAFKTFEREKRADRAKQFESSKIVSSLFSHLQSYNIQSFVSHWDFLVKRFFVHLDSEHALLTSELKADLLKFYLVNAFRNNAKDKINEFFKYYSHEILVADGISRNLRPWFVLPYVEKPDDDSEFAIYFTAQWSQDLRMTLTNFISTVLRSAPPPKLLLLERWFRSESQQEIRSQLKLSMQKMDIFVNRLEKNEDRLAKLRDVVKELVSLLLKTQKLEVLSARTAGSLFDNESSNEASAKEKKNKDLGTTIKQFFIFYFFFINLSHFIYLLILHLLFIIYHLYMSLTRSSLTLSLSIYIYRYRRIKASK